MKNIQIKMDMDAPESCCTYRHKERDDDLLIVIPLTEMNKFIPPDEPPPCWQSPDQA